MGKTRTGVETVRQLFDTGQAHSIAPIGRTVADARKVLLEGRPCVDGGQQLSGSLILYGSSFVSCRRLGPD